MKTVNFNGKAYTLKESAEVWDNGNYRAGATGEGGKDYIVEWEPAEEWKAAEKEAKEVEAKYPGSVPPDYEYPAILGDESMACDWDHPSEVYPC